MKKTTITLLVVLALILTAFAPMATAADELDKNATITLWLPASGNPYPEGTTENDNPFINAIREHTGYPNLTVELITDGTTQMNLLMASGEYPDAIYVNGNRAFFLEYLTQGLWLPVDEAVEKYGPAIKELMTPAVLAATQGDDGQHYAISMPLHTSYNGKYFGNSMFYDTAILSELGLEVPTDADSLYNVLAAVKEKKPDLIPLSLVGTDCGTLKSMFGMWTDYTIDENGKIVNTKREYMKDYVTYMHKLYEEGILDPESLYQTGTERDEKLVTGKLFMTEESVWCKKDRQTIVANGGEFTWDYLPPLENIDGTKGNANPFPTSNIWMFPSAGKHMNEVVDIINTFLTDSELETFVNYGEEGVHFRYDDDGTIQSINDNGEYDSIMYKMDFRLWFKPDIWLNNAILGDYMPEIEKYTAVYTMTNYDLWGYMPTSEASIEYSSTCNDIISEYRDKIIVGELPVDAIDEMFEKLDANGYTEIEAACQEWYDKTGKELAETLGLN
ncbi:MAG: extracellular solute-binding protein [bacterium]|nr:extracellular solute-binding protein [bacterium]